MSTGIREPLELQTGDHMSREEFHRIQPARVTKAYSGFDAQRAGEPMHHSSGGCWDQKPWTFANLPSRYIWLHFVTSPGMLAWPPTVPRRLKM
jgi:hypothetical protein